MPLCPKCGEEIDFLKNYAPLQKVYRFALIDDKPDYCEGDIIILDEDGDYECPECHECLFDDEDEATAFFRGEDYDERDSLGQS